MKPLEGLQWEALRLGCGLCEKLGVSWFCRIRSEPRAVPGDVQGPKVLVRVGNANRASLANRTG